MESCFSLAGLQDERALWRQKLQRLGRQAKYGHWFVNKHVESRVLAVFVDEVPSLGNSGLGIFTTLTQHFSNLEVGE